MPIRPWLLASPLAALVGIGLDAAASDFSFAWIEPAVPAGAGPQLAPGATAVLEVRVHADSAGVWGASIGVEYDPSRLRLVDFERCPPAPGNEFGGMGSCGTRMEPLGWASLLPVSFAHVPEIDNALGRAGVFAAECGGECGQYDWTFELVHLSFEVLDAPGAPASTEVSVYYPPGISGIGSVGSSALAQPPVPPAALFVLPAAAVPALPGAGLLALGAVLALLGARLARSA